MPKTRGNTAATPGIRGGRLAGFVVLALALWFFVVFVLGPSLIRAASRGAGPRILVRMLAGRGRTPPEQYLDVWYDRTFTLTFAALALLAVLVVIHLARRPVSRVLQRMSGAEAAGPALGLATAIWIGLLFGLIDAAVRTGTRILGGQIQIWADPQVMWLGPVALATLFVLLALIVVVPAAIVHGPTPFRLLFGAFASLGAYDVLRSLRIGIHPLAALVLAAGLGLAIARRARVAGIGHGIRRSVLPLSASFVLLGAGMNAVPAIRERIRLAARDGAGDSTSVLLIILDTVRAQSLSLYGYGRPTTPNLERLASRAVVFENAIAPSPWTLPSHGSILTGRLAHELNASWRTPLDGTWPTVPQVLDARGYSTAGFVGNLQYATRASGLGRGFTHFDDFSLSAGSFLYSTWITERIGTVLYRRLGEGMLARKHAPRITASALRWISKQGGRPFFVMLNYFDAHRPYEFHPAFSGVTRHPAGRDTVLDSMGVRVPIDDRTRDKLDNYDTSIAALDDQIGILVDSLEATGRLANTLVIVTADHGEQFGERGVFEHGNSLYMPVLRVPLLIIPPGGARRPRRIAETVGIVDLAATMLDMSIHDTASSAGRSLFDVIEGWSDGGPGLADPIIATVTPNDSDPSMLGPFRRGPMIAVTHGHLHYILNGDGVEELYDINADPREEHDLTQAAGMDSVLVGFRRIVAAESGWPPGR